MTKTIELNTRPIDCPIHAGQHKAVLYRWPHRYAGIWECEVTGDNDVHDHSETMELETTVSDHLGFNGHYQTEREIYVCALDGVAIDLDVADPLEDRAEAQADYEMEEAD